MGIESLKKLVDYEDLDFSEFKRVLEDTSCMTQAELNARVGKGISYREILSQVEAGTYRSTFVYPGGWDQLRRDLAAGVVE